MNEYLFIALCVAVFIGWTWLTLYILTKLTDFFLPRFIARRERKWQREYDDLVAKFKDERKESDSASD